jgi:hypothetical protein
MIFYFLSITICFFALNVPMGQVIGASPVVNVYVKGVKINYSATSKPYVTKGTVMVPAKITLEKIGAKVTSSIVSKKTVIKATLSNKKIELVQGNAIMKVNGTAKSMGTPITIKNGTTYMPVKVVNLAFSIKLTSAISGNVYTIKLMDATTPANPTNPSNPPPPPQNDYLDTRLYDTFEGYDYGNVYKTVNGSMWVQTSYQYEYKYAYMPDVIIVGTGSTYKMSVDGTRNSVNVALLSPTRFDPQNSVYKLVSNTRVSGQFDGLEYNNQYELMDGSVWRQTSFDTQYKYKYMPNAIVYYNGISYKMKIEGTNKTISVTRLR